MKAGTINEMTTEQLRALLSEREAHEKRALETAKKAYEQSRDQTVKDIMDDAKKLHGLLAEFKKNVHEQMEKHGLKLAEYGEIRSNSKGGFSLQSSDGLMRIRRRRDTEPQWDERSQKAIELIRDFLGDTIKKRDRNLFEILMSFLQRNIKGELEYSRVMDLLTHEDKYDDPRWKEGLRLIKESFSSNFKGYGYEFQIKCEKSGKWEAVSLNFSSFVGMRAYRKAFESEDEVKLWKRDNCMDCQNFSNCELKEHIGMEMEIKHAFKVGYEDIGFGYIVLDKLCRYSFPNRLGDYVRIKGFKK